MNRFKKGKRISKAGVAQLVEHDLAKVGVASSSLVSRSFYELTVKLLMVDQRKKCEINPRTFCFFKHPARVVESVDTQGLKSCG